MRCARLELMRMLTDLGFHCMYDIFSSTGVVIRTRLASQIVKVHNNVIEISSGIFYFTGFSFVNTRTRVQANKCECIQVHHDVWA